MVQTPTTGVMVFGSAPTVSVDKSNIFGAAAVTTNAKM